MLKISVTIFTMLLAMVRPEPPVSSYLPARTDGLSVNEQTNLSTQYGVPDFDDGRISKNGAATSNFGSLDLDNTINGPSKLYGIPVGEKIGGNGLDQSGFAGGQSSGSYEASASGVFKGNNGNRSPSSSYGVPPVNGNNADGFNGNNNGRQSNNYGAPNVNGNKGGGFGGNGGSRKPSSSYGTPNTNRNNGGGFENGGNRRPPTSYGTPNVNGNNGSGFGRNGGNGRPSSSYGVPNRNNGSGFGGNDGRPSSNYGVPDGMNNNANDFDKSNDNRRPLTSYGVPGRSGNNFANGNMNDKNPVNDIPSTGSNNGGGSSRGYGHNHDLSDGNGNDGNNGYPFGGPKQNGGNFGNGGDNKNSGSFKNGGDGARGYNENAQEESNKPTKYEFSYEVKDKQSGSEYGHTETRDGDRAQGEFNVLLPDGRKQIVEYEADQDGFKPQIRYEGEANTGGYDSNGLNDGYSFGRPNNEGGGFTDNSRFNGDTSNGGYPDARPGESTGFNSGGSKGYQSERSGEQSFGRGNDGGLNDNVGGYFSNIRSNNIGDTFTRNDDSTSGNNRQNGGNGGYQY